MNTKIKIFAISTLLTFNIATPTIIYGAEMSTDSQIEEKSVKLIKASKGDVLRANIASGDDVILKLNVDLEKGRSKFTGQESTEFPARLFLTDGENESLGHPEIQFNMIACCNSTSPQVVLPTEKPESFESFSDYSLWLSKAYFTNQVTITVDFPIDTNALAPDLIKQLPNNSLTSYRIKGSYVIDTTQIAPDQCLPTVKYLSNRDKKVTIVTLGGSLILGNTPYVLGEYQQQQPHHFVRKDELNYNATRKIICSRWIASSTELVKSQYQEFPANLLKNWPTAPSSSYWAIEYRPDDLTQIRNFSCYDSQDMTVPDAYAKIFIADNAEVVISEKTLYSTLKVKDEKDVEYRITYEVNKKPQEKLHKRIEGYEMACGMFLPGKLVYSDGKIELKNDRFKEITEVGISG